MWMVLGYMLRMPSDKKIKYMLIFVIEYFHNERNFINKSFFKSHADDQI